MTPQRRSPAGPAGPVALVAAVTAVLVAVNAWFLWKPRTDQVSGDTLIHLVFARNALKGRPFEFNTGHPSRALTAPLWNWTLAAAGAATGRAHDAEGFLLVFRILAIAVCVATLVGAWRLARRLGSGVVWAAGGLGLLASNPSLFYWVVANPMETAGAAAFAVAFVWWSGRAAGSGGFPVWAGGGLLAGAGFLMRPELLVFGCLAAAAAFVASERRPWRAALAWVAAVAAVLALWSGFLSWSGLAVLPNAGSARRLMLLIEDARRLPVIGLPWSPDALLMLALFLPLLAGAALLTVDRSRERRAAGLTALFIAGFTALFFSFYFFTTWQGRYVLPAVFALLPPGVAGLSRMFNDAKPWRTAMFVAVWSAVVAALLLRMLAPYADAPRQRALPKPDFVDLSAHGKSLLCQEIQSTWFEPGVFTICTEGLIGLEALDARKRGFTVRQFIDELHPDLIGPGRYPLNDPEGVGAEISKAGTEGRSLALPGLELEYLGVAAGCGPVFKTHWQPGPR